MCRWYRWDSHTRGSSELPGITRGISELPGPISCKVKVFSEVISVNISQAIVIVSGKVGFGPSVLDCAELSGHLPNIIIL